MFRVLHTTASLKQLTTMIFLIMEERLHAELPEIHTDVLQSYEKDSKTINIFHFCCNSIKEEIEEALEASGHWFEWPAPQTEALTLSEAELAGLSAKT